MSGGSVPAHMTDANDKADEGGAPFCEQKKAPNGAFFVSILFFVVGNRGDQLSFVAGGIINRRIE